MNHDEKKLIKNAVVIPLIIAVITAGAFFVFLSMLSDKFPFTSNLIYASDFNSSEIIVTDNKIITDDAISKTGIISPADNMIVGSIDANGKSMELIYNANAVNAVGRFNILPDSRLIGEIGSAFAQCYKADADFVKQLSKGDTVRINTYYGNFVYEVTDVQICNSASDAEKLGDGVGRALVLYADSSEGIGISDNLLTVVCRMTSRPKVTE